MRIAMLEDGELLRTLLLERFKAAGVEVVAEATTADELLTRIADDVPDAVLLDIRLPPDFTDEGIRAAEKLRERYPRLGILVLSAYAESSYAMRLLKDDASGIGYLLKDRIANIDALMDATRRVVAGECVIDPNLVELLLRKQSLADDTAPLTDREREVLRCVAEGYSNLGIAERLGLSQRTVEVHLANIFTKLGIGTSSDVNRRVSAVLAWLRSAGLSSGSSPRLPRRS
jgi:DNA-binding NarL/FixJ family response regulator